VAFLGLVLRPGAPVFRPMAHSPRYRSLKKRCRNPQLPRGKPIAFTHDVAMKTQDPSQELQDGVDLARAVHPEPQRILAPAHPRICEAGPCRNYHRLEDQIDDGSTLSAPSFHIRVTHYCYPSPGIEMPLGALPVVRCNRWDPIAGETPTDRRRQKFNNSSSGAEYAARVKTWEDGQREQTEEIT
jgi:hypothetical protein